jgi:hypothetical protein
MKTWNYNEEIFGQNFSVDIRNSEGYFLFGLGHDPFLPNPFRYIISNHLNIRCYVLCHINRIVKYTTEGESSDRYFYHKGSVIFTNCPKIFHIQVAV